MSIIYYDLNNNETGKMFTDCLLYPQESVARTASLMYSPLVGRRGAHEWQFLEQCCGSFRSSEDRANDYDTSCWWFHPLRRIVKKWAISQLNSELLICQLKMLLTITSYCRSIECAKIIPFVTTSTPSLWLP